MIATNKEQSERLLACGTPTESADMTLCKGDDGQLHLMARPYNSFGKSFGKGHCVPAWSLTALLKMLPTTFSLMELTLTKLGDNDYEVFYWNSEEKYMKRNKEASTPIEACVQMIEELCKG